MTEQPLTEFQAPFPSTSTRVIPVVIIPGDGIGPEVTSAARCVLDLATAGAITWVEAEAGAVVFARGDQSGVPAATRDVIATYGVAFKGPLETPIGSGAKSANVTLRKLFGLYGNVRPARELPGVGGVFAGRGLDLCVVRENVEDLYAGIEHLEAPGVAQALKVMTKEGCERIVRLAFELARSQGRRRVEVVTKANILKLTEGMLLEAYRSIAPEYPEFIHGELLVDNCAHQLVIRPEHHDVLICSNLHGDIISDLTSGLVGGLGVAPSANLGDGVAIFEPVHGSAPDIAGRDLANPTAAILAGALLLRHLGLTAAADAVEGAIGATLTAGIRTTDLDPAGVSCSAFAAAVCERLTAPASGAQKLQAPSVVRSECATEVVPAVHREDAGIDIFIEWRGTTTELRRHITRATLTSGEAFELTLLALLGNKVWPDGPDQLEGVVCARFTTALQGRAWATASSQLLAALGEELTWVHVERLSRFDGTRGWTLAQGER